MFGKVIYFDEEKVNEYKSVVLGEKNVIIKEVSVSDEEFCRLLDEDYIREKKELEEYRDRKGM